MAVGEGILKILILEDSPSDAKLIHYTLTREGMKFESQVVDSKRGFLSTLDAFQPDVILSDHSLAGFDSREALSIAQEKAAGTPFILVTGTVSEDYAVSAIKSGASDYLLKGNLSRLPLAIRSALSQKKAREELKKSEEQFQHTIDGLVDGVEIIGFDWTCLYMNDVALQGESKKTDLIGRPWLENYPWLEGTPLHRNIFRCMHEREFIEMESEAILWGEKRWFSYSIQPTVQGVLILSRDITEGKKAMKLLEHQNSRIKNINTVLDRFLYSVSHELRTPICNGLGLINLAKRLTEPAQREDVLNKLDLTIRNLDSILQNIGVFCEISGREIKKEEIAPEEVFSDCLKEFSSMSEYDRVKLSMAVKGDRTFVSDRRYFHIILKNLLSNGIKFRSQRQSSYVMVEVECTPEEVKMAVSDNGIGIKKESAEKIYRVFYKGDTSKEGSGLGLYTVREALNKLGGSIAFKPALGDGTVFTVRFPNGKG